MLIHAVIDSSASARKIILTWDNSDTNAVKYFLSRKLRDEQGWRFLDSVPASVNTFADTNLAGSNKWEYQIIKHTQKDEYRGYGYVYAGYDEVMPDYRGIALLLIDETIADTLKHELDRFREDLEGDGYRVKRYDVHRTEKFNASEVRRVKNLINYEKENRNGDQLTMIIIGRVAVPYAGNEAWDGHDNHMGAWPADVFYATDDNDWTDENVFNIKAEREENKNVPHDGKFDQSNISGTDIRIGRIDFYNLPSFNQGETELLRNYLDKNHAFRTAEVNPRLKGLIDDGFKMYSDEAFAATAWMNMSSTIGKENIETAGYMPSQEQSSYLWSYSCNSGSYNSVMLSVYTDELAQRIVNGTFTMLLGSYFGDWDSEDNVMRATLASRPSILTCCWSGRPFWFFHHMSLGEPIGYSALISANNNYLYPSTGMQGSKGVHIDLMGDPTLRQKYHKKVTNFTVDYDYIISNKREVRITWDLIDSGVTAYRICRAKSDSDQFEVIGNVKSDQNYFIDKDAPAGVLNYMIRTVNREISVSGNYFNLNEGVFLKSSTTAGAEDIVSLTQIQIVPNPCTDILSLYLPSLRPEKGNLSIISTNGHQTISFPVELNAGTNIIRLEKEIKDLSSGIYYIRIITPKNLYLGKVSIIH